MVLGLFGLTLGLAACPSDDGEGSGTDGETESTTSGTMSGTSPSTSTTAMSTSSSSSSTTMEPTTEMMTESTTNISDTDTDTDPGTTTGGEDCETCVADSCGKALGTCAGIKECNCWLECAAGGGDPKTCAGECMGPPPEEYDDVLECIGMNCQDACFGGGSSSSGTGGGDGIYEPCEGMGMCPGDLECHMFDLGICTQACDNDDECPDPASGDATAECGDTSNQCVLNCQGDATCPEGLECIPNEVFGDFCGVPA
jgi:hypothetical protein